MTYERDKAKRLGLPLSKIPPPLSPSDFSSFCLPADYCLTTIFPKPEKLWNSRRTKGFHGFLQMGANFVGCTRNPHETWVSSLTV